MDFVGLVQVVQHYLGIHQLVEQEEQIQYKLDVLVFVVGEDFGLQMRKMVTKTQILKKTHQQSEKVVEGPELEVQRHE